MPRTPVTLALVALLAAGRARGQDEDSVGDPYWIATPAAASAALRAATTAIVNQDRTATVRALQRVFDAFPDAFTRAGQEAFYVGTRQRALEMLATLPTGVREEYERLYGSAAEQALREALATRDREALLQTVRRYEATEAGRRAILALADSAMLRARPAEARLLLARIPRLHPDAAHDAALRVRIVAAAAADRAQGGPPPAGLEAPPEGSAGEALPDGDWCMLGGDATRARVAPAPLVRDPRFSVVTDLTERTWDRSVYPMRSSYFAREEPFTGDWEDAWREYAPLHPVIARARLVYHDGRQVVAINLYTGEEQWRYPEQSQHEPNGRTSVSSLFSPVIGDGVVYAAVEVPVPFAPQRLQGVPITYYIPARRLVAIDLDTGKPLWTHEDAGLGDQAAADTLRNLSITGPPLVRGERIYVGASYIEGTFHNFLLAVERRTGRLAYATRISTGQQELNLFGRQLNEVATMPVAEAGGILYFGTNLGVFAAVDAVLGTPLWAATYPVEPIPSTFLWYEAPRRWPRFENGPPLVVGDVVVLAPVDSRHILALDRRTGRVLWERHRYGDLGFTPELIVGADAARVYVSGPGGVAALRLDGERGGEIAWRNVFPEEDIGTGRGFLAEDGLWVPGYTGLYRFDTASGKLTASHARDGDDSFSKVNLVWGDGVLVTAGRDLLCARFEEEDVLRLARERVRLHPGEIDPLLAAADIHLATGRLSAAIEHYRRARMRASAAAMAAAETRAQVGLHRALMERAEERLLSEPDQAHAQFDAAIAAAPDGQARLHARLRLDALLAGRGGSETAEWRLANLREIERQHGDAAIDAGGRTARGLASLRMAEILVDRRQIRRAVDVLQALVERDPGGADGREAAAALRNLLETEGRGFYEAYEKRARKLFQAALAADDLDALDRGLLIYANAEAVADATLELARRRTARGDGASAVAVLQRLLVQRPQAQQVPQALVLMVRALHARGSYGPAFSALQRLRRRHPEARVRREDGALVTARALADEWLAREPYARLATSARRLDLEPPLAPRFERRFPSGGIVDVPDLEGRRPASLGDAVFLKMGSTVAVLDARSGKDVYRLDFDAYEPRGPIVFAGGHLLALTEQDIYVFDAESGRLLARPAVPEGGQGLALLEHQGQAFALFREMAPAGRTGVAALHAEDGTPLWIAYLPAERVAERISPRHVVGLDDRLLLLSARPVRLTVVNTTSGAIENRILIDDSPNTRIAVPPRVTPDGRLLVGLLLSEKTDGVAWKLGYAVHLVDPSLPAERAAAWPPFQPPDDNENRYLRTLGVIGQHIVALDDAAGAAVIDLRDGRPVRWEPRLDLGDGVAERPLLTANQPSHDTLLLVATRPREPQPGRLAAFEIPDLQRRYSVTVAESAREAVEVIEADGVVGFMLMPRGRLRTTSRILLFDPLTARLVQEIVPAGGDLGWFTARVQNGMLLVSPAGSDAFAYGPR